MSTSMFTGELRGLVLERGRLLGVRHDRGREIVTRVCATVSEMPSTAIEPLGTTYSMTSGGAENW
jgi:hypothetical protein